MYVNCKAIMGFSYAEYQRPDGAQCHTGTGIELELDRAKKSMMT